jgi:glycosyltransferase involved in cell wall biosynthesis
MSTVLLNALASTAGGGITWLRNVLPRLARLDAVNRYRALVPPDQIDHYRHLSGERLTLDAGPEGGLAARLWWEQTALRGYLKRNRIDVLVSLGNFALLASPAPQILYNRNDLHFSRDFERDLLRRGRIAQLASNRLKRSLARLSIREAEINVAPSAAFAARARGGSRRPFEVLPFGFDPDLFAAQREPLSAASQSKLDLGNDCRRLLYVSHYNYFRNFETLLRALPLIVAGAAPLRVQLVLTTDLSRGRTYGGYDATAAAELIDRLGIRGEIAMLGAVPYSQLPDLYRLSDVYVGPSYAESFGHPLLEAMAAGLPVACSNLEVHREVCGEAALYFDPFDERALAAAVLRLLKDRDLARELGSCGRERSRLFSWDDHVRALIGLIATLTTRSNGKVR